MKEFALRNSQDTVSGGVVDAFLAAFGPYRSRGETVLKRHLPTIGKLDKTDFCDLSAFMQAMRELQDQFGRPFIEKMGARIYETAPFPPGIDSVEKVMALLDAAYHMNHNKGADIGSYVWKKDNDRRGIMTCDNPYPCSFDLGLLRASSKRFAEKAVVTHHEPSQCRHNNAETCIYIVEW